MSFRLGKTRFSISYPLAAMLAASLILDRTFSTLICLISAVIHELGHLAALHLYGETPAEIRLTLFDAAISDRGKAVRGNRAELVIVLSGVAVNLAAAAVSLALYAASHSELFYFLLAANLTLGVFNSLPVISLDGGQALFIIFCRRLDPVNAQRLMHFISVIILLPLACLAFLLLFRSPYKFSLLLTVLYLFASLLTRT